MTIQFIHSLHPHDAQNPKSQQRARAHAARVAHSRKRQFRLIEYNAANKNTSRKTGQQKKLPESKPFSRQTATTRDLPIVSNDLLIPSPVSQLASDRTDPFASSARSFTRDEHFLFDYFVQTIIPDESSRCGFALAVTPDDWRQLIQNEWMPFAVSRVDSLDSLFLHACRHLLVFQQLQQPDRWEYYMQLATKYKLACLRAVNEAISAGPSVLRNDATVATVVLLGFDEMALGDMATSKSHAQGALQIVEHNGGFQTLGLNGFLESLLYKLWGGLEDAPHGIIL
ncbi:hypothetical protein PISL3812_01007 [Talaromyces islandicus]|uniref:Uncharacterized protein n=1 Tax=Talaromyces islandicus TaxID=28573 RepID=A0A0U1LLI9_TALIS|nr:hypothetical protein PISL3812_01007 [Talaromyces islandicus]